MAEDAVSCELLSAQNSLLTGKNTGNMAPSTRQLGGKLLLRNRLARKTAFLQPIGTGIDQGIIEEETGNAIPCYEFLRDLMRALPYWLAQLSGYKI